jgi:hypothetical protein
VRQFDEYEPMGRKEIIFTALIDYSNISVHFGIFIRNYSVNLVKFQGCFVVFVSNTNRESKKLASFDS